MTLASRLLLSALAIGTLSAEPPPRSPSSARYKELYLNSAFTDPPPEVEVEAIPNDLPDWVLVGLSKYVDGVTVKLMNKKDRSRVTIPSADATKMGFSIKEVKQDRNFIDEAVVTVQKGSSVGEVRFDPQFLTLKQSAGPAGGGNKNAAAAKAAAAARAKAARGNKTNSRVPLPSTPGGGGIKSPPKPGSVPTPSAGAAGASKKTSKKPANVTRRRFFSNKK